MRRRSQHSRRCVPRSIASVDVHSAAFARRCGLRIEHALVQPANAEQYDAETDRIVLIAAELSEDEDEGDDVEDDEDDSLLEEVEEDEDDVSGIIDADIEKDER